MRNPNQTFHQEEEAKTPPSPVAVYPHSLSELLCRGRGGRLLRIVKNDYTAPRRAQPQQRWSLGVGRTEPCLSDPKVYKIRWQVALALLLFLPMTKVKLPLGPDNSLSGGRGLS